MSLCCTANGVECDKRSKNTVYVSKTERSRILNSLKRGLETKERRLKNCTVVQDLTVVLMKLTQLRARLYEVEQKENCKHVVLGRMMDIVKDEICGHLKKDWVEPSDVCHVVQRTSAIERLVDRTWNHVNNDEGVLKVKLGSNKSTNQANSDLETRETVENVPKSDITFGEGGDSRPEEPPVKNHQYMNEDNGKKRETSLTNGKRRSRRSSELKDIMMKGNDRHTVGLVSAKHRFVKSNQHLESIRRKESLTDGIVLEKKKSIVLDLKLGNSPAATNGFGILKRNVGTSKRRKVRIASTTSTEKYTVESKLESSNVIELLKSNIVHKNFRRFRDNNQQKSEEEGKSTSKTRFSIRNHTPPKSRAVETSTSYDDFILDPYFSWNNPRVADISRKKYVIDNKSWRYTESEYSSGAVSSRGTMTQVSCFPKTPAKNQSCQTDTAQCEAIKQVCYLRVFYTSTYLGYSYPGEERADLIDRSNDWFVTCRTDPAKGLAHFTLVQNTMTPGATAPKESAFTLNRAKNSWLQRTQQLFGNTSDTLSNN